MTDGTRKLIAAAPIVAGSLVETPAGRTARVLHVDEARREADVELLAVRCAFRLSRLRPLEAPAVVLLPSIAQEGEEKRGAYPTSEIENENVGPPLAKPAEVEGGIL